MPLDSARLHCIHLQNTSRNVFLAASGQYRLRINNKIASHPATWMTLYPREGDGGVSLVHLVLELDAKRCTHLSQLR